MIAMTSHTLRTSLLSLLALCALGATAFADVDRFIEVQSVTTYYSDNDSNRLRLEVVGNTEDGPRTAVYTAYTANTNPVNNDTRVLEQCHRYALMAQSKPSKYILNVQLRGARTPAGNTIKGCGLERAP
jgi:hypothetical protein